MRNYIFLILVSLVQTTLAQSSIDSRQFAELSAFEAFQSRKYQSVINELAHSSSQSSDEEILLQLSKLKTGNGSIVTIEKWLKRNPKHPIKPLVYFHLGEYYFYQKDTINSRAYLSKIQGSDLTTRDRAAYGFVYGLLQLDASNYKNAKSLFQFARKNQFEEIRKLNYYEAFADYHLGNDDDALNGFEQSKDSYEFGSSSKFFIAKIQLDRGNKDEVIALTQSELSDEKSITNSGFHQLVGEAYALKDDEAKADAYFERAIELHPGTPSAALFYQAGVSKFKIGNEDQAIEFLTNAGIQGGEYAQLSAFQLGRLYLKKKNYEKALAAYIEASVSEDKVINEESYFYAATINAQLGFFSEAISYSNDYLKKFKNGRIEKVQNLIAQSYLRTSNFDLAIQHLNEIGISNKIQKEIYQKVTYQKAMQAFNDGQFSESEKWFKESLRFTSDQSLKNSSNYHLAEIAMQSNRFNQAISYYNAQSNRDGLTRYGLGYAYYNKKQYANALPHFKSAVSSLADERVRMDARVRLADCLYATKSYSEALSIYTSLSTSNGSPYLVFQRAMTHKNLGQDSQALRSFSQIFSSNRFGAEAKFQSGMIRFENAEFKEAESYFTQVINDHSSSSFILRSLLNRGIARKNLGDLQGAKKDYETILEGFIDDEIALNAILGMQELQQAGLNIRNLDKYIDRYREANPESGSLELVEFEAAKRLYFDFSYDQAALAFEKYLKNYPASQNKTEAKYYMGDSYYRVDKLEKAKPVFDELKFVRNALTGRILYRLGDVNRRLKLVEDSESAYQLLIDLNLTPKDTYNARQGLMQLYFDNNKYNEAISIADQIIQAEWKPLNAEREAMAIKAKSAFELNNLQRARESYQKLAKGDDIYAAESNYYLGLILYREDKHKESLDILFDLNSKFGSYTKWVDQSYLLIAKNYVELDELFQAKATLRSIIQHSENQEIKEESVSILNKIEQVGSESDSSIIKD